MDPDIHIHSFYTHINSHAHKSVVLEGGGDDALVALVTWSDARRSCRAWQRSLARRKTGSGFLRTAKRLEPARAFLRGDDEYLNMRTPRDGVGVLLQGLVVWSGGAEGATQEEGREARHGARATRAARAAGGRRALLEHRPIVHAVGVGRNLEHGCGLCFCFHPDLHLPSSFFFFDRRPGFRDSAVA